MAEGHVVVVGAGHAGVQCAASLREGGFRGTVTIVSDEGSLPYQRPPLSKEHLHETATPLPLRGPSFYEDNDVALLRGVSVERVDRRRREVVLRDGRSLPYTGLVLATGARARCLPSVDPAHPAVHLLRTLADAERLRAALTTAHRAVVVGGGFLGLEFAAGARQRGVAVTVLEAAPRVLARSVSPLVSAHLQAAHEASGVRLVLGEGLSALRLDDRSAQAVVGTSGEVHPADLVVLSVGAAPRDELAREAGLAVDDGVLVDEHLRTSDPAVLAVGDCARLSRPAPGAPGRLESVQNATDQARHAAQVLLGVQEPYTAVPWFWSNQGTVRLQIAGVRSHDDATVTVGEVDAGRFSVLSFCGERLTAVESMGRPADHLAARRLLAGLRLPTPHDAAAPEFLLKRFAADPTPATT